MGKDAQTLKELNMMKDTLTITHEELTEWAAFAARVTKTLSKYSWEEIRKQIQEDKTEALAARVLADEPQISWVALTDCEEGCQHD